MSTYEGGEIERMKRERVAREVRLRHNITRTYYCPDVGARVKVIKPGFAEGSICDHALEEWEI